MFTATYQPKKLSKFVGNQDIILPFIRWLLEWSPSNTKNKCALVSGFCGTGKTLLVDLILKKHDYNIIYLSTDDERNKENIQQSIKPFTKMRKTFDQKENVLVVSDIDGGADYGFLSGLIDCIKTSQIPIICTCDDRYSQSLKPILNYCFDIKLNKPKYQEIYPLIYDIVIKEKVRIKESEVKQLYDQSNGDIRFILNTLQFGCRNGSKNIQSTNIFNTTAKLLSMDETINEKYNTYWLANDIHSLMIQENYINNTLSVRDDIKKLENISDSADALSDVDLFENYVNMTNWEFEPYVALNTIRCTEKCNKKGMIKFPQFLSKISVINKNRREKKDYNTIDFIEKKQIKNKKATKVEPNKSKIAKKTGKKIAKKTT